jgi:hypothetical protein
MPIATRGAVIEVTPGDEIQIVRGKGDYEFVDDRQPFTIRIEDVLREDGRVIGAAGPVISGASRFTGLIATLLIRLEDSDWERDTQSAANFKVSISKARRVSDFPYSHPDGTETDGYPLIVRYGTIRQVNVDSGNI